MRRLQYLSCLCVLTFLAGCSKEETPTERRVRELTSQAVSALHDNNDPLARNLLHEAIQLVEQPGYPRKTGEPYLLLGELCSRSADFDSALTLLARARTLYEGNDDREGMRAAVLARADAHRASGEADRALDILQEHVRREEALGERTGHTGLLWAMIPLTRELGMKDLEQRLLTQLAGLYNEQGERSLLAKVRREFGLGSLERGEYNDALQHFASALALAEAARESLLMIDLYLQRARTYARMGKINESFAEFTEGLRRTDRTRGSEALREEMMMRVGNIYLRAGKPENARIFFTRTVSSANATRKPLLEGYALLQLGHCARTTEEALRTYRLASELLDSSGVPWARAYAMACLGYATLRSKRPADALRLFQIGAEQEHISMGLRAQDDVFADCESTFYSTLGTQAPEALTELLLQLQRIEDAFHHDERNRRALLQQAYHALRPQPISEPLQKAVSIFAEARSKYFGAVRRLEEAYRKSGLSGVRAAHIRTRMQQAYTRLSEIGDSLAEMHPRTSVLFSIQPPNLADVQSRLQPGTAFIDYIASPRTTNILLITRTSVQFLLSSVGKDELAHLASEYVRLLSDAAESREERSSKDVPLRNLSARLHTILLRPVEKNLPNVRRLSVALPLTLPLVPLHALRAEGRNAPYAVERFEFRYCTDAECTAFERTHLPMEPAVIGIGNPGATSTDVEYEVRDARVFYREAKLLFGNEATLATLKNQRGDLLHAALDLRYNATFPHLSRAVFRPPSGYTDLREVPLGELMGVAPYNTILLSNLHPNGPHPAVLRLFLMNGTSSLIANSYPLPRKTKKRFNELFYAELQQQTAVETAYRSALLYMLKDRQQNAAWLWGAYFLW
ncbi:MAG TPA: CHAT domain-containing protein [Bacteroidota bacterium]|nr:CHAT domain-containing protein [Bacteroidota bacterium]